MDLLTSTIPSYNEYYDSVIVERYSLRSKSEGINLI